MPKVGERFNPHRVFTGVFIPDAVYGHPELSSTAKLLYGRLCKFKGDRGDAYPAAITMAKELGISERQVFDHLARLVDEGFIDREPRLGTSTVYHFLWHPSFEDSFEVVRKTALPGESPTCGNPHQGSAENRTTGSAENRVRSESFEKNQGSESNTSPTPSGKDHTQSPPSPTVGLEECDEDGIIPDKRSLKRVWGKKLKPERPHAATDRLRQMREGGLPPATVAGEGLAALIPTRRNSDIPSGSTPPTEPPARRYVDRWNELVPEKPMDPVLFSTVSRRVWDTAGFDERFEDICRKAGELLRAGVDVHLLRLLKDYGTGLYGWQDMLAGGMDPRKKNKPVKPRHADDWEPWMGEDWESLDWQEKKARRSSHAEKTANVQS